MEKDEIVTTNSLICIRYQHPFLNTEQMRLKVYVLGTFLAQRVIMTLALSLLVSAG